MIFGDKTRQEMVSPATVNTQSFNLSNSNVDPIDAVQPDVTNLSDRLKALAFDDEKWQRLQNLQNDVDKMLGGIKEVQEESEFTSSLKATSQLKSSAFDRLKQMVDSGLTEEPDLPAHSELSKIDPL